MISGEIYFVTIEKVNGLSVSTERREISETEYRALVEDFVYQGEDEKEWGNGDEDTA